MEAVEGTDHSSLIGSSMTSDTPYPARVPRDNPPPAHRWLLDWASPWEYTAHALKRQLFHQRSRFQEIEILETVGYGRCLVLDGEVQSFEQDEFIYHESLVQPAMLLHPAPRRVLVIGGGEGATLRELLRHRSVERAVMVDLDPDVIAAAREFLPSFHSGAWDDPRVALEFGDGRAYVETAGETFDVVVIDVTNPMQGGPSFRLFTREFYRSVLAKLAPGGIAVLQSDAVPIGGLESAATIHRTVRSEFPRVFSYAVFLPSYTVDWSFTLAGRSLESPTELTAQKVDLRIHERQLDGLRFYDGIGHVRMFHLPRYVRDAFDAAGSISCDQRPMTESYPGHMGSSASPQA